MIKVQVDNWCTQNPFKIHQSIVNQVQSNIIYGHLQWQWYNKIKGSQSFKRGHNYRPLGKSGMLWVFGGYTEENIQYCFCFIVIETLVRSNFDKGLYLLAVCMFHNGPDGVSNHQSHTCSFNRLFRRRSKKISKLRVTGLCVGNSPVTDEFPAQM